MIYVSISLNYNFCIATALSPAVTTGCDTLPGHVKQEKVLELHDLSLKKPALIIQCTNFVNVSAIFISCEVLAKQFCPSCFHPHVL